MVQQYWRDLCTSQNWDDGGCLRACIGNVCASISLDACWDIGRFFFEASGIVLV
jgi:hypothetical protein